MRKLATTLVAALGIGLVPGVAAGSAPVPGAAGVPGLGWNATWAASPHAPTEFLGPNWGMTGFDNHTVRQVVRISDGGAAVRIRLSNAYGTSPLVVTGATVARTAQGAAVRPDTVRHLSFRGHRSVTVPVGGEVVGDLMLSVQDAWAQREVAEQRRAFLEHAAGVVAEAACDAALGPVGMNERFADEQKRMIECRAVIKGEWKLLFMAPPYGENEWHLFNLRQSPFATVATVPLAPAKMLNPE